MTGVICVLNVLCLGAIAYYLFHYQYKQQLVFKKQLHLLQQSIQQIIKDHPILIHADLVFARQMREITHQLISMDNQLQSLENKRDNDGGYQHALRILEMGGNREEIIDSCHLSSAEAELMMNLQAYRAAMGDVQQPASNVFSL